MNRPIKDPRSQLYERLVLRGVLWVLCILFVIFVLPTLISYFIPFIAAFLFAWMLNPLVNLTHRKTGLPRRFASAVLVTLVFLVLATALVWCIYLIADEAFKLAANYHEIWDAAIDAISSIYADFPMLEDLYPKDDLIAGGSQWIADFSNNLLASQANFKNIMAIISTMSNAVVGIIIFVMAAYFFSAEYFAVGRFVERYFGNRVYGHVRMLKNSTQTAFAKYFKSQLLLALLAFAVMFVALFIYGNFLNVDESGEIKDSFIKSYAFLIALFLGIIDFLPIIGTAAILLPWALYEMAYISDFKQGIFLIALAGGFFVIRRFAEPKILGSQTGLHPIVALMSIYLGFKIAGVWGAILGPVVFMMAVSIFSTGLFDNTIRDIRDAIRDITGVFRHKGGRRDEPDRGEPDKRDEPDEKDGPDKQDKPDKRDDPDKRDEQDEEDEDPDTDDLYKRIIKKFKTANFFSSGRKVRKK
jgi:sporulation integral membrane protein YtvI